MYYKAFDKDLRGYNGFQFEVGKTYTHERRDSWRWFHYSHYLRVTLWYYANPDSRFCIVEPQGMRQIFHSYVVVRGSYWTTPKIRIVRELSREEVYEILFKEHTPFWLMNILKPPFEVLQQYGKRIRGNDVDEIIQTRDDFTLEQIKALIPKKHHHRAEVHEDVKRIKERRYALQAEKALCLSGMPATHA